MKLDNRTNIITNAYPGSGHAGADFRQKVRATILQTKESLLAEFAGLLAPQPRLLRLALNEAEAVAWQNPYPHLLFPMLAVEKAQQLAAWHARQESLRLTGSMLAIAA